MENVRVLNSLQGHLAWWEEKNSGPMVVTIYFPFEWIWNHQENIPLGMHFRILPNMFNSSRLPWIVGRRAAPHGPGLNFKMEVIWESAFISLSFLIAADAAWWDAHAPASKSWSCSQDCAFPYHRRLKPQTVSQFNFFLSEVAVVHYSVVAMRRITNTHVIGETSAIILMKNLWNLVLKNIGVPVYFPKGKLGVGEQKEGAWAGKAFRFQMWYFQMTRWKKERSMIDLQLWSGT